jgi:hypothetical protein
VLIKTLLLILNSLQSLDPLYMLEPICWNVEAGVAVDRVLKEPSRSIMEANAFRILACIGSEAMVISGDAKGAVVGKHGII